MTTAVPRRLSIIVLVFALVALLTHGWVAIAGGYLNYVSGIWLAHAGDLVAGVFYRDLVSELGYGGTRYFPLFFVVIAAFLKVGAPPLAAGWLTGAVAVTLLATGMAALVRGLGGSRPLVFVAAAASIGPYFVQQTLFEFRADVLAAALNVWGLAYLLRGWDGRMPSQIAPTFAALFFTLAVATKITGLVVAAAALSALAIAGLWRIALGVGVRLVAFLAIFLAIVQFASSGRALDIWRACMFAGTGAGNTVGDLLSGSFLSLVTYSRLIIVMAVSTLAAVVAGVFITRGRERLVWVATALAAATSLTAALTLSSPGTVPSNQMVEWVVVVVAVLSMLACASRPLTRPLIVAVAVLATWTSVQDLLRARDLWRLRPAAEEQQTVASLIERVRTSPSPVLSESPLWPVVAGQLPVMLDPFASRVVMETRPELEAHLRDRLRRREFGFVILQFDPATPRGQGYYTNVNFGWPITSAILDAYELEGQLARDVFVYVPRPMASGR